MGYVRKKTVKISFAEGHEFAGLEVRMKTVGLRKLLRILPMIDRLDAIDDISATSTPEEIAEVEEALEEIAKVFDSWNMEDEDAEGHRAPVPCTHDSLMDVDLRLVVCVLQKWAEHIAGVPAPLGEPSTSGGPSLEGSIPMDVSSPSLAS